MNGVKRYVVLYGFKDHSFYIGFSRDLFKPFKNNRVEAHDHITAVFDRFVHDRFQCIEGYQHTGQFHLSVAH